MIKFPRHFSDSVLYDIYVCENRKIKKILGYQLSIYKQI